MGSGKKAVGAVVLLLVGVYLAFSAGGCGGGSGLPGPGGVTVADAGGMWQGPGGTVTPAGMLMAGAMQSTLAADMNGNVTGGTGPLAGVSGTLSVVGFDILKLAGPGFNALLIFGGRDHILYVDDMGRIAALQRGTGMLMPPYLDGDVQGFTWSGTSTEATGSFDPLNIESSIVTVLAGGAFTVLNDPTTGMINSPPTDPATGEYQGTFMDPGPPPAMGAVTALLTPDRQFAGVIFCSSTNVTFPGDCRFAGLLK